MSRQTKERALNSRVESARHDRETGSCPPRQRCVCVNVSMLECSNISMLPVERSDDRGALLGPSHHVYRLDTRQAAHDPVDYGSLPFWPLYHFCEPRSQCSLSKWSLSMGIISHQTEASSMHCSKGYHERRSMCRTTSAQHFPATP